jgi:GR25 family glycosyltransferase involved in LPS biosynthesis
MKAFVITLPTIESKAAANCCKRSATFDIETFDAVTPNTLTNLPGKWTYPWTSADERTERGIYLSAYQTVVREKRIACFVSHYRLWELCTKINEPVMVLEHDAEFIRKFDYSKIQNQFTGEILGLNDPRHATRKSNIFHNTLKKQYKNKEIVVETPWVDDKKVPQGLAGNSAYIIKPTGAKKLLDLVKELGMWPNDAIMCKQLMPDSLQCVYPYYTKVQGTRSTTTK